MIEQEDDIGGADRAHPMRNRNYSTRASLLELRSERRTYPAKRLLERLLTSGVHRRRRLVEKQQLRLPHERAGNCHALFLATAQLRAASANVGMVLVGQSLNRGVHMRCLARCDDAWVDGQPV